MADTLATVRKTAGLTQQQVADRTQLTQPLIAMLEAGRRSMSPSVARSLAYVYKRSPEELMKIHAEDQLIAGLKSLTKMDGASLRAAAKSNPTKLLTTMKQVVKAVEDQPREIQDAVSELGERVLAAVNTVTGGASDDAYTDAFGTTFVRDAVGKARPVHKSGADSMQRASEGDVYHDVRGVPYRRDALGRAREVK